MRGAKRWVVKIGTGALTNATGRFNREHFDALAADLAFLARGRELVVVSSGAIALGVERLGLPARPRDIPGKQACAAVGQSRLMQAYEEAFAGQGRTVAQVLLTQDDVQDRRRYLNARNALRRLLAEGAVPIVNENDTVSVDEIRFGDNDKLAGLVTGLVEADALVILSDVEGLYAADPAQEPKAELIREVSSVTHRVLAQAGGSRSGHGTGRMATKVRAAAQATEVGAVCVITSGRVPGRLRQLLAGEEVGTRFAPQTSRRHARTAWLAHAVRAKGKLVVDDGARKAVCKAHKSLLPSGIRRVEGSFTAGDPVELVGLDGAAFARGIASYASEEMKQIAGQKSARIETILGYRSLDEA
ncbi:MAG TPA: glutamate 5-kinase, partial [Myxococcaceae bacterium]|nr:glutamate 5-kinase [Myxococcaceae bacterium]